MADNTPHSPRQYLGVMVSSTTDLGEHRAALIKAINAQDLTAIAMEDDSARPAGDVIDSSLDKVRDAAAYVLVISHKYGQIPQCPQRNPKSLSLTELEFDEASGLGRPTLLFIMGENHAVRPADVEKDPEKIRKLEAFREKAKRAHPDSSVHRVYNDFSNLREFEMAAMQAIAALATHLKDHPPAPARKPEPASARVDAIPAPPAFHAEPPYIGSHEFLGRRAQMETLDNWARPANPKPVLLVEAIGGTGKSILTWHWVNEHAPIVRPDWAGRFWYSFYERGAVMADFCRRALAYMTGRPLADFRKQKTPQLAEQLLQALRSRPWLLVLDGLERVLVSYHRYDAAQLPDQEAGVADVIGHRDPCAAIRPEDDDLLRQLAAAAPSKLLITTRLTPRILLNPSRQPIPGVLRERLPGLQRRDAEDLLRACGIEGDGAAMQTYLQTHCDCHPLVTGVLAGLIHDHLPARGNFDLWAKNPEGGGRLNLAELDLVQKRNHILHFALAALPETSGQLLSTLALLSEAVDYSTLAALNPHPPPEPEKALARTVADLERRGLLQYDRQARRYDLHPVVRGVAAGRLSRKETELYGGRVVDHFSRRSHTPYEQAESLDDLLDGLQVVRTLLCMGHYQEASDAYRGDLAIAMAVNLETYGETLSLLRPFFPLDWARLPDEVGEPGAAYLANMAALALREMGDGETSITVFGTALLADLRRADWHQVSVKLHNLSVTLGILGHLAREDRALGLGLALAEARQDKEILFMVRLFRFRQLALIGRWAEAEALWLLLDPMGRDWARAVYRPGISEYCYAVFRHGRGDLREEHLAAAEQLAQAGKGRRVIREIHSLRGLWRLEQGQWAQAADSLHEAVRMDRAVGRTDATAETGLAVARFHRGQLADPRHEAGQLAKLKDPAHGLLAKLWLALDEQEPAIRHALMAYRRAWADGEPYVRRHELNQARALLDKLGVPLPDLPPHDPAKDEKPPWEDELAATIEKLRAEKAGAKGGGGE